MDALALIAEELAATPGVDAWRVAPEEGASHVVVDFRLMGWWHRRLITQVELEYLTTHGLRAEVQAWLHRAWRGMDGRTHVAAQ